MKRFSPYLLWAYGFLGLTLLSFVVTGVILEGVLSAVSLTIQRGLIGLTLILPAVLGLIMGILELRQPERRPFLAILAIVLNGLIALFFTALLGIAG
jgi:hypothetical protein